MAGVGFSLRALGARRGYQGMLGLYGAASVISCGPWLLSVLTLLGIGVAGRPLVPDPILIERFQVCVTWLLGASLVLSGPLQLQFTRFIADQMYLEKHAAILPNLEGALACISLFAAAVALALFPLFPAQSLGHKLLLGVAFVTLSDLWIVIGVLNGQRRHLAVLGTFALGYGVTFGATLLGARHGELGLLCGFAIGQATLLFAALATVARDPAARLQSATEHPVAFGFLGRRAFYLDLLLIGLVYNASIWIDKLAFWFNPATSRSVLGPLRGSDVYDLPIFLAYLSIVPGMAVFLVRVETDFAECHASFYAAIREGASLGRIEPLRDRMTDAARRALCDILGVQGLTLLGCLWFGSRLLDLFGISRLHLPLFYVDAVGVALQVLLLAITSIFFYLDCRRTVLGLTLLLFGANLLLTLLSQRLGAPFYGYGFAVAMAITGLAGLVVLRGRLRHLVRDTFMLQPLGAR